MLQKLLCPGHKPVKVQEIVVLEVVEKEILRKNTEVPLLQQPAAIVGDTAANNGYLEALPRSHFTEEQIQRATTLAVKNDFGSGACRRSCRYGAKMGFKEGVEKVSIKKAFDMIARSFSKVIQSGSLMPITQR